MTAELLGALFSAVYGMYTAFRKGMPLFYKIVLFALLACLMGHLYTLLHHLLRAGDGGFHVGYLGYLGMFFFLYSSYYGAINSLADGKEPHLRRYRLLAGLCAGLNVALSLALMTVFQKPLWMYLLIVPMTCTLYFAFKLLIIPDVEMGIIRVMRPYNGLIVGLCICMLVRMLALPASVLETVADIAAGLLLALSMPLARKGVQKWFTF